MGSSLLKCDKRPALSMNVIRSIVIVILQIFQITFCIKSYLTRLSVFFPRNYDPEKRNSILEYEEKSHLFVEGNQWIDVEVHNSFLVNKQFSFAVFLLFSTSFIKDSSQNFETFHHSTMELQAMIFRKKLFTLPVFNLVTPEKFR